MLTQKAWGYFTGIPNLLMTSVVIELLRISGYSKSDWRPGVASFLFHKGCVHFNLVWSVRLHLLPGIYRHSMIPRRVLSWQRRKRSSSTEKSLHRLPIRLHSIQRNMFRSEPLKHGTPRHEVCKSKNVSAWAAGKITNQEARIIWKVNQVFQASIPEGTGLGNAWYLKMGDQKSGWPRVLPHLVLCPCSNWAPTRCYCNSALTFLQ